MSFNTSATNLLKYLNNADLLYKYNSKSIFNHFNISKINLEFSVNNKLSTTKDTNLQNSLQLKIFILLFLITNRIPYINCNKFSKKNFTFLKSTNFQSSFIIKNTCSHEIYSFLFLILSDSDLSNQILHCLTSLPTTKIIGNNFNMVFLFSFSKIMEYKDLLDTLFIQKDLQGLQLRLNLNIKKNIKNNLANLEFKNFFLLWNLPKL